MTVTQNEKERPYWSDPIIEEIWQMREEHAKQFNYDLKFLSKPFKRLGDD